MPQAPGADLRRGIRRALHIVAPREHGRAGRHTHPLTHQKVPLRTEHHIHARTELDQSDALPGRDFIPGLLVAHNPPRNQAGNLLKHHARAVAFHLHRVLLVCDGSQFLARHQEPAFLILHARDGAADGRAIHVHVEDVQKNTDALLGDALRAHRHDLAIGRRDSHRTSRNLALRIAEKIQAECRKNEQRQPEPWLDQVRHEDTRGG